MAIKTHSIQGYRSIQNMRLGRNARFLFGVIAFICSFSIVDQLKG